MTYYHRHSRADGEPVARVASEPAAQIDTDEFEEAQRDPRVRDFLAEGPNARTMLANAAE
jgi:hypothetical protein